MRLNDILNEQQINELDWKDVAHKAGKNVGGAAKGTVDTSKSFISGIKKGYQQGGLGNIAANAIGDKLDKWASNVQNGGKEAGSPSNATTNSQPAAQSKPSGITYKQPTPGSSNNATPAAAHSLNDIKTAIGSMDQTQLTQIKAAIARRLKQAP